MALKTANLAVSKLASSISAGSTSISITSGDGAKFPALSNGDWFPLALIRSDGTIEFVEATARTVDTFTVIRGQEGTPAITFNAGDRVELRFSSSAIQSMLDALDSKLGKTAQAADSAGLGGKTPDYYAVAAGVAMIGADTILSAADFPGVRIVTASAKLTLPAAGTVKAGVIIKIKSSTTGYVSIAAGAGDSLDGVSAGSWQIPHLDTVEIASDGVHGWYLLRKGDVMVGDIKPSSKAAADPGFLLTKGDTVSRTDYAGLFNAITRRPTGNITNGSQNVSALSMDLTGSIDGAVGWYVSGTGIPANTTVTAITTNSLTLSNAATATFNNTQLILSPWPLGDGITTFQLPDTRGRTLVSAGAGAGLTNRRIGEYNGEEKHALTSGENGPHAHGVTDGGHGHSMNTQQWGGQINNQASGAHMFGGSAAPVTDGTNWSNTNISIQSSGSGTPHNIMQPYMGAVYMIKL